MRERQGGRINSTIVADEYRERTGQSLSRSHARAIMLGLRRRAKRPRTPRRAGSLPSSAARRRRG